MPTEKHGMQEQRHVHKEDTDFKITARRNKLTGLWAAGQMGLSGPDADAYSKEVVLADFEEVGDQDIIRKLVGDMQAKGVSVTEDLVKAKLLEFEATARDQTPQPE
ncbi:MAG: DUF1476 domain-containing protein [Rhodospirillaceae bacterium]|nr:DUF1476 domain-containing protein [Rhodospirillales bacterium]